jgi:hypothetical protein
LAAGSLESIWRGWCGTAGESRKTPLGSIPRVPKRAGAGFTGWLRSVYFVDGAFWARIEYRNPQPKKRPVLRPADKFLGEDA